MEKLLSRISRKMAVGPADEVWISEFDLDYAYRQLQLSRKAMQLTYVFLRSTEDISPFITVS